MDNVSRVMGQQNVLKELKNMGIDRSFIVPSQQVQKEEPHDNEMISRAQLRTELLEMRKMFDQKLQSLYQDVVDAKAKVASMDELQKQVTELRLELQKVSKEQSLISDQLSGRFRPQPMYQQPQMYPQYQAPPQQAMYQQPMEQPVQTYNQPVQHASHEESHPYQAYLNSQAPPKPVQTKPIDRNNVAPSDVQLDKYFNFANKRPGMR